MRGRIRAQYILIVLTIILLFGSPACLLLPKPTPKPPVGGKSLIIGSCVFHWLRGGGEVKEKLKITVEELISGTIYQTHTDNNGFYSIPNVSPGIYILKSIQFLYQEVTVEHEPLMRLFIVSPGKVFYLGGFVVEADTADLKRGKEYPGYEKYITGDLTADELRKVLASHKEGQGWVNYEIVVENELEKF